MTTPPDAVHPEPGRDGLLAPSTLRPVELDLRTVFWVITGCFAVALVVTAVLGLTGSVEGRTVAICATGVGLGFLAQAWVSWREASTRRREAGRTSDTASNPAPATPEDGAA